MKFDVCCILLYTIQNDARTLNIARTLHQNGKRIAIIALAEPYTVQNLETEGLTVFPLKGTTTGRFIWRWMSFALQCLPILFKVRAHSYWAADGYVLPLVLVRSFLSRARLYYDSREIYSALGALARRPFVQVVISGLERFCLRYVDTVVTSGVMDSAYLMERYQLPYNPPAILNLPPFYAFTSSNFIRNYYSLPPQTRIVLYQGMIFYGRGLLPVVRALPLVEDCVFVLIGEGDFCADVKAEAERCGITGRVFFTGKVPYDELPQWTMSADLGVTLIEPVSLSYSLALPNKLFEYCMAGIPSLVTNLPAMRKIIEQYDIGRLVEPDAPPEHLANEIRFCLSPEMRKHFTAQCKKAATSLNWQAQEQRIMMLFPD